MNRRTIVFADIYDAGSVKVGGYPAYIPFLHHLA